MAEIRKHKPGSGQGPIAQALEQALGAAVRPTTPGAPPEAGKSRAEAPGAGAARPTAYGMPIAQAGGWVGLSPAHAPKVAKATDEDEDELFEE